MQLNPALSLPNRSKAVLMMILSAICWGLGTVMSKMVLTYLPPLTVLVVQLAGSVTFLWAITLIQQPWKRVYWHQLAPPTLLKLGFPGLLEPALSYSLGLTGLAMTTASNASLINATEPMMALGLAWVFLRERICFVLLILMGMAIGGVLLTVGVDVHLGVRLGIGDLLLVVGTFSGALYAVLSQAGVRIVNPVLLAAIQQSFGLIGVTLVWISFTQINVKTLTAINPVILALIVVSGIIQYALGFWLYLQAIKTIRVSIAAQFLSLIPIFGVGGAYLFLGERLSLLQGLGMLLVVGAIAGIAQYQRQSQSDERNLLSTQHH
ncbi:DMT family transporter [Nostoc sp. FACHB-888]|uniref:DMT family transporter n=1 Tax=Nostoc sp. FACHB-888 TaxID=2692842 RepID=UPI00168474D7|nr:DMT family transporter [Nostoc sp. FACHB-888]MBD2249286.1 DMT family transporter [Nostoc sp. FACHB-888]